MGGRGHLKAESGTCNVCSAPCSSCMHLNLGFMGSKSDESSGDTCPRSAASQSSVNEDDALRSSRVKAHNDSLDTASEASNLINVNSIHDLSDIAESTAIIRPSYVSNDVDDVEMRAKSSAGIGAEDQVSMASNCFLDQSKISNMDEISNIVEGNLGKTSCDDRTGKLSLDNPNQVGIKDLLDSSAVASNSNSDGSGKGQGSKNLESCNAPPKEVKLLAVSGPSSIPENVNSLNSKEFNEKLGAECDKDHGHSSDEAIEYSSKNENCEKSGERLQEPNSPAVSEHGSDDSEMVEHDVKVCDICGDAGREDLLAICIRCSDGAEHTYCMREMLQEVPEGEWLCEECKFAEEAEKPKREEKGKREVEVNSVAQSFGKRRAENVETVPDAKRQAIESHIGSPQSSNPATIASVSRDSSLKSLDKGKGKLAHQLSFAKHSNDDVESTRSTSSNLQLAKGNLSKSNSFSPLNSRPKVKLVDTVVLPRPKGAKDTASLDVKDGSSRTLGKSMPLRSAIIGSLNGNDAKARMAPSKYSHPQETKVSRQVKDWITFERKTLSKLDHHIECSPTGGSTVSGSKADQNLTPHVNANRELKGLPSDGKLSSLTKQANHLTQDHVEVPVPSVGSSTLNEICSSSEPNSNQTGSKNETASTSNWPAEGLNGVTNHGLSRLRESKNLGEKSRESFVNRPRSGLFSGSKGLPSQKGGQSSEQCSIDAPPTSDNDASVKRNLKEVMNKGNRLRAAVDAALRKKPSFCKNRGLDHSEGSLASNMELSPEKTSQNQLPALKMVKNLTVAEVTRGKLNLTTKSDPCKQTLSTNGKHLGFPSTDAVFRYKSGELDASVPSAELIVRDWPLATTVVLPKTWAIPQHEYMWQGSLEVQRDGNLPELHSGIQAHLSTLASSKVLEAVNKFPERVPLTEVQRSSTWPAQFHESGAKEDHIALFFFAKDIESYEKNYRHLVSKMIEKDLALKGNLDGVELLMFASNQLPQNCQRWNTLYFLWGVFRGRKEGYSNPPKTSYIHSLNMSPQDRDVSNDFPKTHSSSKHTEKESSEQENPCNTTVVFDKCKKVVVADRSMNNKESSIEQPRPKDCFPFQKEDGSLQEGALDTRPALFQETGTNCDPGNGEKTSSFVPGDGLSRKTQPSNNEDSDVRVGAEDEKIALREDLTPCVMNSDAQCIEREHTIDGGLNHDQAKHQKRPYLDLTEPLSENSSALEEKISLVENSVFADEGSMNKKLRTDPISYSDGSASEKCEAGPSSSTAQQYHTPSDERVIPENVDDAGKHFFPLDLNQTKYFKLGDQDLQGEVPNLELALGAEETPSNRGLLPPFLSGRLNEHDDIRCSSKEEDDAASLSLSLSFHFPEKEQRVKPAPKTEPQRQSVNPSMLFFRDFSDK